MLLDLNLPDSDGLALLPQLRTAPDSPTVIAVTARELAVQAQPPALIVRDSGPGIATADLNAVQQRHVPRRSSGLQAMLMFPNVPIL